MLALPDSVRVPHVSVHGSCLISSKLMVKIVVGSVDPRSSPLAPIRASSWVCVNEKAASGDSENAND